MMKWLCVINSLDLNVTDTDCSYYSVLSAHLTSSKLLVGIAGVVSEIQKQKKVSTFLFLIYICMFVPINM